MSKALENSQKLKRDAEEIIKQTEVNSILSQIGNVSIVGSYELDVMSRPDVDFCVVNPLLNRDKVISATEDFLKSGHFRTVAMTDAFNFTLSHLPKGYFFELTISKDGVDWIIDIQCVETDSFSVEPTREFKKLIKENPKSRNLILEIKNELLNREKYKKETKSTDIYYAVLRDGIKTKEEFFAIISR